MSVKTPENYDFLIVTILLFAFVSNSFTWSGKNITLTEYIIFLNKKEI